jgi:hypothetical protein
MTAKMTTTMTMTTAREDVRCEDKEDIPYNSPSVVLHHELVKLCNTQISNIYS